MWKKKTPGGIRTRNFQIRSLARYPIASRGQLPDKGIEPLATRLKVWRSTDWASRALKFNKNK